ncbi:hypothetical protein P7K49_020201, partial [Saguinus oedipus]
KEKCSQYEAWNVNSESQITGAGWKSCWSSGESTPYLAYTSEGLGREGREKGEPSQRSSRLRPL